jgi:hypothetical protein
LIELARNEQPGRYRKKKEGMKAHMSRNAFFVGLLATSLPLAAMGEESVMIQRDQVENPVALTGHLRVDLLGPADIDGTPSLGPQAETQHTPPHKSPWLAAGMSLVVPGAGEVYAESYWKAAAFFAIEVAAWSVAYAYDKKGDRQTDFFQGYAHEHWEAYQYAEWTLNNANAIHPGFGSTAEYEAMLLPNRQVDWAILNQLERDLGEWYSHSLPPFGSQQYYELIGKYQQFYQGWDDADPALTTYGGITAKLENEATNFKYYSAERGKANDYYSTASTAVTIAIVNHILSAIDAAWSAGSYNTVHASVGMQTVPVGGRMAHVPVAKLSYGF